MMISVILKDNIYQIIWSEQFNFIIIIIIIAIEMSPKFAIIGQVLLIANGSDVASYFGWKAM